MIFVFAGWKGSHHRAMETLIGSCATVEEAHGGVGEWAQLQKAEWHAQLATHHPKASPSYSYNIVYSQPLFWFQFTEVRNDDLVVILEGEL